MILITIATVAVAFIYLLQFQVVRDYKPYRMIDWEKIDLLDMPEYPPYYYIAKEWKYSIFSTEQALSIVSIGYGIILIVSLLELLFN